MDWFDPETWKLPASLIDYWKTILGGGVVILTAVGTFLRWGFKPFRWAWSKIARTARPPNIERPLRFVQNEQQSFWGPCQISEKKGTQVVGHWQVTNMTERRIWLLQARLHRRPRPSFCHIAIQGEDGLYSRNNPVPNGHMVPIVANLDFYPPITSGSEPLIVDVIFTDNFEDEHRARATFRYVHAPL